MARRSRIAFGSCNHQDRVNKLWPIIEERDPAAFVWGGDAIYGDVALDMDWSEFPPKSERDCATPERLTSFYDKQKAVPGYRRILQKNITVFGTFDDHDYGCNNADRTYPYRQESAEAFVKFLGETSSAMSRRAREGHGLYGVKVFDFDRTKGDYVVPEETAGVDPDVVAQPLTNSTYSSRSVAVFVIDCRSHKTPWKKGLAAYYGDLDGDFLGERQWRWLETALSRSRASVNIVVNGLQVHANIFPDGNVAEAWGRYPRAQQRLFDAMLQENVEAPILISGDVHMAQFMRKDCTNRQHGTQITHPLIEMTTSGMTHSWGTLDAKRLENPVPTTWQEWFESFVASSMMRLLHTVCPWTDLMVSESRQKLSSSSDNNYENGGMDGAKTGKQYSLQRNFGELEFDWEEGTVSMRVLGEDESRSPLLAAKCTLDQLSGRAHMPGGKVTERDYSQAQQERGDASGEWTCVSYRGRASFVDLLAGYTTTGLALVLLVPFPFLLPTYILLHLVRRYLRRSKVHPLDSGVSKMMR